MKGEVCKIPASQANYSLTSRPPSWKVGEMVKVLHTERGQEHSSHIFWVSAIVRELWKYSLALLALLLFPAASNFPA